MACTTILVGKKASYDGSTLVARNEDSGAGNFDPKRFAVMSPKEQPKVYKSVLSHVEIPLPENPMRYTYMPNSNPAEGIWGAFGVNEKNVSMTATETICCNSLVLGADPLVVYDEEKKQPGGIGEEDMVTITLPYITSARDGVKRLGMLLETYGTYEMNGIAFQDEDEIWWLETIGGHNWIAKKVPDDTYVVMPNQLGIDFFDFEDAYGEQKEHMCSEALQAFVEENHLDRRMNPEDIFNPRDAFGTHDDSDHIYNTPRAWVMLRYFNPRSFVWDGPNADFGPESDDLPWAFVPERKITLDEIKWVLSNHYQGTPYDMYGKSFDCPKAGKYRAIGVNRNNALGLVQIRPYMPDALKAVQWIALGSNVFNAMVPFYTRIDKTPAYLAGGQIRPTTDNFYWTNRIIVALADPHFGENAAHIERYQGAVSSKVNEMIKGFDQKFQEQQPEEEEAFFQAANQEISDFVEEETGKLLDKVLYTSSCLMKNSYSRSDN